MLSQNDSGWEKELNIVNWNGQGGKFDIREWNPEHDKMSKGITLSEDELFKLYGLLKEYFNDESCNQGSDSNQKNRGHFFKVIREKTVWRKLLS